MRDMKQGRHFSFFRRVNPNLAGLVISSACVVRCVHIIYIVTDNLSLNVMEIIRN